MIAFLACPTTARAGSDWNAGTDTCMLPVVDRPMLQHILETLADQGVTAVHVRLPWHDPHREELLGDGSRWDMGISVWYGPKQAEEMLAAIGNDLQRGDKALIIGKGDCLPGVSLKASERDSRIITGREIEAQRRWMVLAGNDAREFVAGGCSMEGGRLNQVFAETWLDTTSPDRLLQSQHALLAGDFPSSRHFGRQTSAGIWVGRGAQVHSSVKLQAPIYIGPFARIERGACLGPDAVIGDHCVIGNSTHVKNSMIAEDTLVGESLFVESSVLLGAVLHNARYDVQIRIHTAGEG